MVIEGVSIKIVDLNLRIEEIKNEIRHKEFPTVIETRVKHFLVKELNSIISQLLVLGDMSEEFERAADHQQLKTLLSSYEAEPIEQGIN